MAIQSFFKPRRVRTFEYKYIYWDARKEALERRKERIRNELIASGEIEGEPTHLYDDEGGESPNFSRRVRGKFSLGTEHLQKQIDEGIDRHDRAVRMIRLMLMLLGLGFAVWYFIFR